MYFVENITLHIQFSDDASDVIPKLRCEKEEMVMEIDSLNYLHDGQRCNLHCPSPDLRIPERDDIVCENERIIRAACYARKHCDFRNGEFMSQPITCHGIGKAPTHLLVVVNCIPSGLCLRSMTMIAGAGNCIVSDQKLFSLFTVLTVSH